MIRIGGLKSTYISEIIVVELRVQHCLKYKEVHEPPYYIVSKSSADLETFHLWLFKPSQQKRATNLSRPFIHIRTGHTNTDVKHDPPHWVQSDVLCERGWSVKVITRTVIGVCWVITPLVLHCTGLSFSHTGTHSHICSFWQTHTISWVKI